ncbi:hypothetical protein HDU93_004306 [Gonapodya sp. JEL0774]|nr:hypothetical protein HDU93_004306 [Gonapodya sp. JEL0774]
MWAFRRLIARLRPHSREPNITPAAEAAASSTSSLRAIFPSGISASVSTSPNVTNLCDLPPEILLLIAVYLPFNGVHRLGSLFPELNRNLRTKLRDPSGIASRGVKRFGSVQNAFYFELSRATLDTGVFRALLDGIPAGAEVEPQGSNRAQSALLSMDLKDILGKFCSIMGGDIAVVQLAPAACRGGHLDILRTLLEQYQDARELIASDSLCMMNTAISGNADLMHFLIDLGADIYADEQSPLFAIAHTGAGVRCLEVLLSVDVHAQRLDIERALLLSAYVGNERVFLKLFSTFVDRGNQIGKFADSTIAEILHFCAARGLEEPVRFIASSSNSRIKAPALITAARRGHDRVVRALLAQGDIPREVSQDAIVVATRMEQHTCVQILMDAVNGLPKALEPDDGRSARAADNEPQESGGSASAFPPQRSSSRSVHIRPLVKSDSTLHRSESPTSGSLPRTSPVPSPPSKLRSSPRAWRWRAFLRIQRSQTVPRARERRGDGGRDWRERTFRPLSQMLRRIRNPRVDNSDSNRDRKGGIFSWWSLRNHQGDNL